MYSTVSIRIGIFWCIVYCVNKDRDLLVCTVVAIRIESSWCVHYCVIKDRDLLVCAVLCQ